MSINDIRNLPRSIREGMESISNSEVDDDAKIQALIAKRNELEQAHAELVKAQEERRAIVADVERQKQDAEARIAEIKHDRAALAMRIILGLASDAEDASQQQEAATLRRRVEMMELGAVALQAEMIPLRREIGLRAEDLSATYERLAQRRLALKVELARTRV